MKHFQGILFCFLFSQPALAAFCGVETALEASKYLCDAPYNHSDRHTEAILRFISARVAIAEAATLTARNSDVLGIDNSSKLTASMCARLFLDIINYQNIQLIHEGLAEWGTFDRGQKLPNLDPNFKEWWVNGSRIVSGYIVVRWREADTFLVRIHRICTWSPSQQCEYPTLVHLDVHDSSGPTLACQTRQVGRAYWGNWKGSVTPIHIDNPASANQGGN